jgi:ABC-type transport system involved in multi-copper enzyme maturation permease subunit
MRELVRGSLILFQTHLVFALRSKRFLMCVLLAIIPIAFAFTLTRFVGPNEKFPVAFVVWMLVGQVVCPLTALIFASALVSEEVEDRTITYLFSRPIPRASLLVGRWLASMVVTGTLLAISTCATQYLMMTHFTGAHAVGPWLEVSLPMLAAVLLGAAVYSAAFAAIGAVLKYPMILGLLYIGVIDLLLVNFPLPGNIQRLAVQFHLRSLIRGFGVEAWAHENVFETNELIARADALGVLGTILVLALVLGALVVSRKQYELTA